MTLAMPYRDDSRSTLAFSLAVLLHVLLGVAVLGFFLFKPAPQPEQHKVFELVAAPPSDSATDEAAAPGPPNFSLPNPTTPAAPSPPQPEAAQPAPAVVNQPVPPKPALTHASTVVPKPAANQPPLTDYQKFLQQHKVSNSPAAATGRPVPTVGVNVNSIVKNLQTANSGANGQARGRANAASSAEVQDYLSKLIVRLQEAFVPPGGVSGLSADIHLVIGPDGSLVMKVLTRSSGNAEFDDAVRQALRLLTNVDPPPGGVQVSYAFTFTPAGP